jgi:hypothetical protein
MNSPVNVDILTVSEQDLVRLGQVKELQIFGQGSNFHAEGLFSIQIFGAVGSEFRNRTFGYVDLKFSMIHPVVFKAIIACCAFYRQILSGKQNAVWDKKTKAFEKSQDSEARTGYSFFMEHIEELHFERSESDKRNFNIELYNKAIKEKKHLMRYLLVMPAGLRDYTISANGKPEEDEVNSVYRRLISQSQLVDPVIALKAPDVYDNIYDNMQRTLQDLYDYLQSLFDGKNKLVLGKWLGRKVFNSTRNVLTAVVDSTTDINDENRLRSNDFGVGLYQFLRCGAPKTLFLVKNKYLRDIFVENSSFANLTNLKALKREEVANAGIQKDILAWTSMDGLENAIANYGNIDSRHLPVLLNGGKHCVGLLYNNRREVRFLSDISELPEGRSADDVKPITLTELLYMSVAELSGALPALATRYPINGYGGIFPGYMKVRTTSQYDSVIELDSEWNPTGRALGCFPRSGAEFMNGMNVHASHMKLLGADHDGDTMSLVGLQSDEAIAEVKRVLNKKSYYLNDQRRIHFANSADVIDAVLAYMTT